MTLNEHAKDSKIEHLTKHENIIKPHPPNIDVPLSPLSLTLSISLHFSLPLALSVSLALSFSKMVDKSETITRSLPALELEI